MSIENVRLIESIVISKDDPRYDELIKDTPPAFKHDTYGHWYDPLTGETVTFANAYEECRYKRSLQD